MKTAGHRFSIDHLSYGLRRSVVVPETLDLAARGRLALGGLDNVIDKDQDHYMWFSPYFDSAPPYMHHGPSDYACTPKVLEAMALLRNLTGDESHLGTEQGILAQQLAVIAEDGIPYAPYSERRPWHGGDATEGPHEDWSWAGMSGLYLRTLAAWYEATGDSGIEDTLRHLVDGVERMLVFHGDCAYYPDGGKVSHQFAYPPGGWLHDREPATEQESCEGSVLDTQARSLHGLSQWYAISGHAKAMELAHKQARFVMKPRYWGGLVEEIGVCGAEQGHGHSHHHGRLVGIRAILAYGHAARDMHALEFARRAYENTRTFMVPRIGWIAANGIGDGTMWMEGCCHADLLCMAIRLSDYGLGDYWDDVDGQVRNMLVEQQLTDVSLLRAYAQNRGDRSGWAHHSGQERACTPDDLVGLFGAFSDFNYIPPSGMMGCCQGNGAMAIGYALEGAVRCSGDVATVNLLINRSAALVDVDSYLPYEGKVILYNKGARRLHVRIPAWCERRALRMLVYDRDGNGVHERDLSWAGNYLVIDGIARDATVEMQFPIAESTATYTVHHRVWRRTKEATFTFRAGTVVDVEPKATFADGIPVFARQHLRSNTTPLVTLDRFTPAREIRHW